jgi:ABC-type antimicrobial peptide transport system permease subunit
MLPDQNLPWGEAVLVWYDYVYTVGIACAAGIVSGFMPALFAARLPPAQAIGYRI